MIGKALCAAALAACAVFAPAIAPAIAQETGIAAIHSWVKVGRKTCLATHFHNGSGTGATRKQAEAAAVSSWVSFTAWEYGSPWGSFRLADSKSMGCSQSSPTAWSCSIDARPCRPG